MTTVDYSQRGRLRDLDALSDGKAGEFIDFFYIPEEISEDVEAEYNQIQILGRSSPIQVYGSTGARSIQIELTFFAEEDAYREVLQKVMWVQSLKYPEYRGQYMKAPHRAGLVIGRFIAIEGILKAGAVSWMAPYDSDTKIPMMAKIPITIEEEVAKPYDYSAVRSATKVGFGSEQFAAEGLLSSLKGS